MIKSAETNIKEEQVVAYSPAAILNAFGNSLVSPILNQVLTIKGVYRRGKGVNYSGLYYDILKDEFTDANVTLVVPEAIRHTMREGQVIEGLGYLAKRLSSSLGRIDLLLHLTDLFSRKDKAVSEDEKKALQLVQQKAKAGYKDIDHLIKERLYEQVPVRVTILIGITAIVDSDIKHQLKDAATVYDIEYRKVNLTRPSEIISAMRQCDDSDILVITRGGGENMPVFDNLDICQEALTLQTGFITAIGHAADEPLLQKMADKYFITPTALGQYFHDVYVRTMEDLQHSRARMITDLNKQIELQYQSKLQDLNARLVESAKVMEDTKQEYLGHMQTMARALSSSRAVNNTLVTVLVVVLILAISLFFAIR